MPRALRVALEAVADPGRAPQMAAYMKHRFVFLGVRSPDRKKAQRPFLAQHRRTSADQVLAAAETLWRQPEREFHYVGMDLLRRRAKVLLPEHLDRVRALIESHSWWDTVDCLAVHTVGPMVQQHALGGQMDRWIDSTNLWVARSAILHQLSFKQHTDAERLFRYCRRQAQHPDFFMRKCIGWALREYSKIDPVGVRSFIETHDALLSGLSKREALRLIKLP